jgi:hypothetical protein
MLPDISMPPFTTELLQRIVTIKLLESKIYVNTHARETCGFFVLLSNDVKGHA